MNILLNITEVDLFNYSNKQPFKKHFNTEYFIFRELFLNLGRILRLYNIIINSWIYAKPKKFEYFVYLYYHFSHDNNKNKWKIKNKQCLKIKFQVI